MKLHDPAVEKSLTTAVKAIVAAQPKSHGRNKMRRDWIILPAIWLALKKQLGLQIALTLALFMLMSGFQKGGTFSSPACQNVVVGFWFLLSAGVIRDRVMWDTFRSPEVGTLWMLPVPGEQIVKHATSRSLWRTWDTFFRACLACGWILGSGPSHVQGWPLVGQSLLSGAALWLMTNALAAAEVHPVAQRLGITRFYRGLRLFGKSALFALGAATLWHWDWLPVRTWLETASPWLLWLLPPAWITAPLTDRPFAPQGVLVVPAIALVALGVHVWLRWPKTAAASFDSLPLTPALPDDEDEAPEESEKHEFVEVKAADAKAAPLLETAESLRSASAGIVDAPLLNKGWLERLVSRTLSARESAILPAVLGPEPHWTQNWTKALGWTCGIIALAVVWHFWGERLFEAYPPLEIWKNPFYWVLCWGVGVLLLIAVIPIGGHVSLGFLLWPTGTRPIPFMCGFPVTSGDLLSISWKMMGVRMLAAAALTLPAAWMLGWMYHGHWQTGLLATDMTARVLWLIFTARPMLVMHRLGTVSKWRRSGWLLHFVSLLITMVMLAAWVLAAIFFVSLAAIDDGGFSLLLKAKPWSLLAGLIALLCSLAIFFCCRWELRRGKIDYGTPH